VSRDERGIVRVQGTDLESIATYCLAQQQLGPVCATLVPFEALTTSVQGSQGRVDVMIETKERIMICSRVSQTRIEDVLEVPPLEDWPPTPATCEDRSDIPWEFKKALHEALSCTTEDTGRPVLSGAFIDVSDATAHYLVGTDGRHLYAANSFRLNLGSSIIIPPHKFLAWNGFIDDGLGSMAVQPAKQNDLGWIEIASPRWSFITRPVEGPYPDWKKILPDPNREKTVVALRPDGVERMLELLPRCQVITRKALPFISVSTMVNCYCGHGIGLQTHGWKYQSAVRPLPEVTSECISTAVTCSEVSEWAYRNFI